MKLFNNNYNNFEPHLQHRKKTREIPSDVPNDNYGGWGSQNNMVFILVLKKDYGNHAKVKEHR